MNSVLRRDTVPLGYALAAGCAALLAVGALAAATDGAAGPLTVLCLCALVVLTAGAFAQPAAIVPLAVVGWLAVIGFSGAPYAQLRPQGLISGRGALVLASTGAVAWFVGWLRHPRPHPGIVVAVPGDVRRRVPARAPARGEVRAPRRVTLDHVDMRADAADDALAGARHTALRLLAAIDLRRQLAGLVLAAVALPLITVGLVAARANLTIADALLVYLIAVVAVTLVGGFAPAIVSAIAAGLLVNWYFTPPLHTFAIHRAQDLLALLLFAVIAAIVSAVVHVAAGRAVIASRSRDEARTLLELARTVLGGADSPSDVLDHLTQNIGGSAILSERTADRWVTVARSGPADETAVPTNTVLVRAGLELRVGAQDPLTREGERLLSAFGAQAAAALDRQRLRAQASQAEMLAAGNRMRTALLAAVSHDLRTPLATVKAGVSSLRQTDVTWSPEDQAELLATVEESADRLDALIANLLDMSRLQTGALEPFLAAAALEDVAPAALRSLEGADAVRVDIPEDLPLFQADPGLLERVLANLLSNALRFSPPQRPPLLTGWADADRVHICVVDHGAGVPARARGQMFEPFQRLGDQNTTTGVGLGLAVAKGFSEAMGGVITASETPGGGLTMSLALLRESGSEPAVAPPLPR